MASENKNGDTGGASAMPQDPEVLAASIEQTRDDLAHTLDEIADKVSPKRVTKRAKERVTETAKAKAAGAREVVVEKAADVKDAVLDAKDAVADKAAELTHGDDQEVATAALPAGAPGPVLTSDETSVRATGAPYGATAGVTKEAAAAGGAAALVLLVVLLVRRRRRR